MNLWTFALAILGLVVGGCITGFLFLIGYLLIDIIFYEESLPDPLIIFLGVIIWVTISYFAIGFLI